jgi:methionyl-tRNA synthetase
MSVSRRFVVTATPPTTNGDLHVGHLGGPYLAADVFTRAQRMLGHTVCYVSGGDDHQTYVVTTAQWIGVEPAELAASCNLEIRETLRLADIGIDLFATPDEAYRAAIQEFFAGLHVRGKLQPRTWNFPWCAQTRRFLLEAFTRGFCPVCFASTSGAICESCGHPNDVSSLLFGVSSGAAPGTVTEPRDVELLVLPLEKYRSQFIDFFERRRSTMRPHVLRFVDEMLSTTLPDFPVTYPADWGVPVTIAGYTGQVFNVWAEMLPGLVDMTKAAQTASTGGPVESAWSRGSGRELVQFLGFDNTFYFTFAHLGLIFASGDLLEPSAIVTNEFFHLDGSKFSTSRRHLIWARELIAKYGADDVRFHLAIDNPEHQTSNFTEAGFGSNVRSRLREPLEVLGAALRPIAGLPVPSAAGASSNPDVAERVLAAFHDRMLQAYALETFSVRQAAESTANLLALLAARVDAEPGLAVRGLAAVAELSAPLLPGLTSRIRARYDAAAPGTVPDLVGLV